MHVLATSTQTRFSSGSEHLPAASTSPWRAGPAQADALIDAFRPINLEQLNAKAEMLQRRDNKYVVNGDTARMAMLELGRHFDILEIDGQRNFKYETCYFDDAELGNYFDQLLDRPQRCKIRTRRYVDSGSCFVEFKFKSIDGITIKKRRPHPVDKYGMLDDQAWEHIRNAYRKLCGGEFTRQLTPVIEVGYKRMTLVAREGGERTTIDHALVFTGASGSRILANDLFIIETKSANAEGKADEIMAKLARTPVESCSKYCLALAALGEVSDYHKFLPALRELRVMR